jgi:uncharacterized cupin superfamily protein
MVDRSLFIANWTEIERTVPRHHDKDPEMLSINASFGKHFNLTRLGIHHERLPPGRRTSLPHAESSEQEFIYVLEGEPDAWINGELFRLKPGDGVGFPSGTGVAHTFLNNTDADVRFLVVGERHRGANRIVYPLNPERKALRQDWWEDAPEQVMGPHDGRPDNRQQSPSLIS